MITSNSYYWTNVECVGFKDTILAERGGVGHREILEYGLSHEMGERCSKLPSTFF